MSTEDDKRALTVARSDQAWAALKDHADGIRRIAEGGSLNMPSDILLIRCVFNLVLCEMTFQACDADA